MQKRICSFVLIIAMLAMLLPSGLVGRTVYAESLGLDSYAGYYCRARVTNYNQLLKVNELSKSQTNSDIGNKIDNMLFHATYRPNVVGGSNWVQGNSGTGISSVYDAGLGTTVSWGITSWGCYAYACFVSKYVRGSTGSAVSKGWGAVPSVSEVKSLIESYADPGEQVRFLYRQPSGAGSVHSVVYLASDNDGFYFISEAGSELTISVLYCTYSYLQSILRSQSDDATIIVYDTNSGKDTSSPTPSNDDYPDNYKVSFSRALYYRSGSQAMYGSDVLYMQHCLKYLGYSLDTDGYYGPGTTAVVKQFQTDYGVSPIDGDCGSITWTAIETAVYNKKHPAVYPGKPTLSVKEGTDTFATTFSWSATSDTEWYDLRVYKQSDGTKILEQKEIRGTSFSYTFASGSYYASLASCNGTYGTWTFADDYAYFTVEKSYFIPKATVYNDGHIYSLYDDAMTWTDAKARCERVGGHLVTITSASEQSIVQGLLSSGGRSYYWIGASDTETEGTFKWVTGEAFSYTNWDAGEPNDSNGEDYAQIYSTGNVGKWNDDSVNCWGKKTGFICEIETGGFVPVATEQYGRNLYELYDNKMAWSDAKVYAESKGGHLVSIASADENNFVFQLAKKGSKDGYYIGATNHNKSNWTWCDGSEFTYTQWNDSQPDNCAGLEYFGGMWTENGNWNDFENTCYDNVGFIIEYENAAAYTVTYDANGGTNAPEAQRKTKGENLTLTTNKPSRNGYEFIGWSTDENATSPTYTAGATFSTDADTTLYAVWKQISSIEIVTMPDKLDYDTYELLDVSGMKLRVNYSDGTTRVITMGTTVEGGNETVIDQESGSVFSPRRLDNIGSHEVTVNYAGLTATYNVNVDDPTLISITIEKLPDKLTYNVGDTLDTTGIRVYANYSVILEPEPGPQPDPVKGNIKSSREITEGYTCTPTVLNTAGTQEITVDYYGRTATFNVTVNRVLTSVTVKTNPDKLIYTMGDTLDPTGLVLTASYNDGYTEDIASGFTCTPTELNTVGTQEITVEYKGKTTTFDVTVNKIVTSVFVMANPNKTTYSAGDTLDTTGMKLLVVYHDGSTQTITEGFTCTPTDLTTVGTQEITAEYGGKTATFEVTVKEAYSLKASPESEQTIGEPVVLTATGGSSYRFYYEQNGKWVNIRNFSTENACLWIPTVPRDYTIYVDIKDESGKVATSKRIEYTVTDAYPFTLDKEGEQNVGVNMTLTAQGGSSYKFYYEYNGAWCNITTNTTGVCEWSPKYAGSYMLYVDIKDASGKVIACRTQAFKLNDPFLLANDAQSTEFSYGRTVNFTAAGGNQYKFYYEKQGEWQRVQDFSSKNTCAWTPTEAGKYNFYCDIKDASGAVVSCKRMTFQITNPYSFTSDKDRNQPVGTEISLTATGGYQYKFYYEKDGSWVRIQSFSTENTCSWTPTVAGRYNVYCDIADENGTVLAYKGMEFVIGSVNADSYTFKTSVESPKPMNTAVTLTATGGSSYKFYYEVGGKWATIKNFSSANTATWTPDMIADYTLYVDIKNSSGKVVKTLSKKFSATDPYSFTADTTSPQNIGKSVKLTATGGASYKFYYQYSGAWVKIQDSTSATCNWKPNKAGEYMVYVDIKNASGTVVTCRTMKLVFNDPYRFTTSASSLTQPAGTAISLSANGGASYKFYYEKDGAWVRIQDYSTTKTCTWTPTEAGKYNVFCDIKDASGSVAVCKRITFNITEKCTITASKTNASVGDTITFTATGGSSYKFYYEKDGAWVRIQSFSANNTCNWKPTAAGDYVVYVDVNDANGNLIGCKGVRCVVG